MEMILPGMKKRAKTHHPRPAPLSQTVKPFTTVNSEPEQASKLSESTLQLFSYAINILESQSPDRL